jgi:Flp pilus assembly protein TadD
MRFQCRFDIEPRTATAARPAAAAVRHIATARPSTRRRDRPALAAVAGSVLLAMGCATTDSGVKTLRVVPLLDATTPDSDGYYALGRYYDGAQAWDKAIDAYRKAIAANARHVEAYNALGVALAQSGRYPQAVLTLRQAAALAPDRAHVLNNLGYVLMLAGKSPEAVPILQAAVALDAGNAGAAANLRDAMAAAGGRMPATSPAGAAAETVAAARQPALAAAPGPANGADAGAGARSDTATSPSVAAVAQPVLGPSTVRIGFEPLAEPPAATVPVATRPSTITPSAAVTSAAEPVATIPALAAPGAAIPAPAGPVAAIPTPAEPVAAIPAPAEPVAAIPAAPADPAIRPTAASAAAAVPAVDASRVEISNGNGIAGMARRVGKWLTTHGIATARLSNQRPYTQQTTVVQYRPGGAEDAERLARAMPGPAHVESRPTPNLRTDLRVVLGHDWVRQAACLSGPICEPPDSPVAAADR